MTQLHEMYGMSRMAYKEVPKDTKWKDLFGIELEVESCSNRDPFGYWTVHNDGSLRDGTEFVLQNPLAGISLEKAIDEFYGLGMKYTSGPRTSTHIHVNMRDASVECLRSMIMVIYTLEDAIFNSVGESRKWSGYSVGLNEMDQRRLQTIMSSNDQKMLFTTISPSRNQERYYGFNTASFRKHGTVEFRYFPGGPTKEELHSWINLVACVKSIGKKYTPDQLTYMVVDEESLLSFLKNHFDEYWVSEFMRHDSLQSLMDKFNVISALSNEPDDLARRNDIVFLNPLFLSFVIKTVLREEGAKYIQPIAKKLGVTSIGEWNYYLEEARRRDLPKKSNKRAPEIGGDEPEDYVDPFDAPVWHNIEPPDAMPEPDVPRPVVAEEPRVQHDYAGGAAYAGAAYQAALDQLRSGRNIRRNPGEYARFVDQVLHGNGEPLQHQPVVPPAPRRGEGMITMAELAAASEMRREGDRLLREQERNRQLREQELRRVRTARLPRR